MTWTFVSILTVGGMLAASTVAMAQPAPATQPAGVDVAAPTQEHEQQDRPSFEPPDEGFGGGRGGFRRPFRGGGRWGGEVSSQEWEEAANFMEKHSPRRWQVYQKLPENRRQDVRRMIYARYRNLQQLREDDPELYDIRMRQLVMEDDVWRLVDELRATTNDQQREPIIEQIRQRVQETTALWLKERQQRLARQEANLQAQKDDLAADRQNMSNIVDARVRQEIERARLPEPAMSEHPPRGGHPGEANPDRRRGERPPPPP